jgi:hypothetical protein
MGKMFMSFCLHKNLLPVIIREKANLLIKHQHEHQPFGEKVLVVHSNSQTFKHSLSRSLQENF